MNRSRACGLLAGLIPLVCMTQAGGGQLCRPILEFAEVHLSDVQPPTLERKWRATVSVDAGHCVPSSTGHFEIVFLRLKEMAPDFEFREQFTWHSPATKVEVIFAADEAVERYWISNISSCRCGR